MTVEVGDRAPGFTLPSGPGEEVDVGSLIGVQRVVLLFFPLAYSRVCTTELRTFRDDWDRFRDVDSRVFAISVDSPYVVERFRKEEELPFPVLSDFNRDVVRQYGVYEPDMGGLEGVAKRSVFVIDEDGDVAYRWVTDDPGVEPDYDLVRRNAAA